MKIHCERAPSSVRLENYINIFDVKISQIMKVNTAEYAGNADILLDAQIKHQQMEKKTLFINEMSVLPQQEKIKPCNHQCIWQLQ